MDNKLIAELKTIEKGQIDSVEFTIGNAIRDVAPMTFTSVITFAFTGYMNKKYNCGDIKELLDRIESEFAKESSLFVKSAIGKSYDVVQEISSKVTEQELLAYILFASGNMDSIKSEFVTPDCVSSLATKILNIHAEDKIADFGCGIGKFLLDAILMNNEADYYGIDINTKAKEIAFIRTMLIGSKTEIEQGDMFKICGKKKFDKIFSNYPFGLRLRDMRGGSDYMDELKKTFPDIVKATSSDWMFNSLLVSCLNEDGKAIGLMTNGSTWNSIDRPVREYFVRKGFIESVIALPDRLFENTSIGTTLIVLSHNNTAIRMVDARALYQKGRRQNTLLENDINTILKDLSSDSEISKIIEISELTENEFVINPSRYLEESVAFENGVEFGSLINRITRGAPLKASELDELVSEEPTLQQYLRLANIQDGIIDDDLPYLNDIDYKLQKYCIKNNSLLLSKNGAPFKVAVANVEEGKSILGNGNLYIIELDEKKVNPYYLKAFFESETGTVLLKQISVGAAMPNISVEALKKVVVPLPSLEEQNTIAQKYLIKLDEIKVLRIRLKKAMNAIKNIYEEG